MTEKNMTIYDELVARGLIAQVTNEDACRSFYGAVPDEAAANGRQ